MWLWGPVESGSQRGLVQETKGNQTRGPWKTANAVLTASLHCCISDWQWYHASLIRFPHPFLCKFFNRLANIYIYDKYIIPPFHLNYMLFSFGMACLSPPASYNVQPSFRFHERHLCLFMSYFCFMGCFNGDSKVSINNTYLDNFSDFWTAFNIFWQNFFLPLLVIFLTTFSFFLNFFFF